TRTGLGVAGADPGTAAGPVHPDVSNVGRRRAVPVRLDPTDRAHHSGGDLGRSAGAAELLLRMTPLHETLEELLATHQAPIYVVHFTQASALERAQALMSINVCTRQEKDAIADLIGGFRFSSGFGKTLSRLVRHGIGVHHAGMRSEERRVG